jgi:hypothetical protein
MLLRSLGLKAQELEAGPYRFLLADSVPVAYTDGTRWFRTTRYFRKGTTKALNKWLLDREVTHVDQDVIVQAFQGISRYTPEVEDRRQAGRRERDQTPVNVLRLAEALHDVLANGRS